MKTTEINGVEFEVYNGKYFDYRKPMTLLEAYERPSIYNQEIYNDWIEWKWEVNISFDNAWSIIEFGIISYNVFKFTLGGKIINNATGEVIGQLIITREHNRLYMF